MAEDDAELARAVREVLRWASDDVPRFRRLLGWLCATAYDPAVPRARAADEASDLGLDSPELVAFHALLTDLRCGEPEPRALAARLRLAARAASRASTSERARAARLHAALLLRANLAAPGTMDFDEIDEEAVAEPDPAAGEGGFTWRSPLDVEQYLVFQLDMTRLTQTGDLKRLELGIARLRALLDGLPENDERTPETRRVLTALLTGWLEAAAQLGGSLRLGDDVLALARELDANGPGRSVEVPPALATIQRERARAQREGDLDTMRRLVGELTELLAALPTDHELRFAVLGALAAQEHELAAREGDREMTAAAARHYRELAETDRRRVPATLAAFLPMLRANAFACLVSLAPVREAVSHALTAAREALVAPHPHPSSEALLLHTLGRALLHAARHLDDRAVLERSISVLARCRDLLVEGRCPPHSGEVLVQLSEALWLRGQWGGDRADRDLTNARTVRREALGVLADDVLLQSGAEHGLSVARAGATHALWLAREAGSEPAQAVYALEMGRALVLRAASVARDVPERLEARGERELAARWRAEAGAGPLPGAAADAFLTPGLRRLALDALRERVPGELLRPPEPKALAAGLTAAGVDALVYLVPGRRPGVPGVALIVRPGGAASLTLPELVMDESIPERLDDRTPLDRYLDAAANRSRTGGDPRVHSSWRAAWEGHWRVELRGLCDWAGPAVMAPVLNAVGRPPGRAPRVVLVPCGPLGAVPWHAARVGNEHGAYRYACQSAVISYASSGAEFLRAARRERLPAEAGQLLVADPHLTLVWAEIETAALRARYPRALRYGSFLSLTDAGDAAGTPEEVLAALPGGAAPAAIVHLACHAMAGVHPARSALRLAAPENGPGDGELTVADILDRAGAAPGTTAGPLVVLSACETDLSTRDHDEALTLATALVSRGATDVIGSRWAIQDGAAAVMMAVFHDALTRGGQAPPDALRAAQLWMLAPDRTPPPGLPRDLAREAARRDLDALHLWAAFTHQGNPAGGEAASLG
ncbi:CHAT domain-containing protein [Streptomyces triticirhizae]|uniref:CHAT domain-containing protein n=1 Tax=Streptomyces triticirhizae TaxID=2483353 RepID=A0A3M2M938_9ACTN|nr:CHAT domain-containing protein [Streptomyces triticirhizae]RMI45999.1 CHAT domain-containing protein [Streptomyces triticirhizae]